MTRRWLPILLAILAVALLAIAAGCDEPEPEPAGDCFGVEVEVDGSAALVWFPCDIDEFEFVAKIREDGTHRCVTESGEWVDCVLPVRP